MKHFIQLQYKLRIALLLTVLIAVILINNISSRRSMDQVNVSVASIYNDRLLVSTYILELTNHLYEKKLLFNAAHEPVSAALHDQEINKLILKYELTVLTDEEKVHWASFKHNLEVYNRSNNAQTFELAIANLKSLSAIQANEGEHLLSNTVSSIRYSAIGSYLEVSLAILIGFFVLLLIGVSKNTLTAFHQRPSMN